MLSDAVVLPFAGAVVDAALAFTAGYVIARRRATARTPLDVRVTLVDNPPTDP